MAVMNMTVFTPANLLTCSRAKMVTVYRPISSVMVKMIVEIGRTSSTAQDRLQAMKLSQIHVRPLHFIARGTCASLKIGFVMAQKIALTGWMNVIVL